MNAYQTTTRLVLLAFIIVTLKPDEHEVDARFYDMVKKRTKFDSKQDFVDYMLKLNQQNGKMGTTRYGKRSFQAEDNFNLESGEESSESGETLKKKTIVEKIRKLLSMLE